MKNKHNEIAKALYVLKRNGYFIDNLWTTQDVKDRYVCDETTAQEILYNALTNEGVMERIWDAIDNEAQELDLTENNN